MHVCVRVRTVRLRLDVRVCECGPAVSHARKCACWGRTSFGALWWCMLNRTHERGGEAGRCHEVTSAVHGGDEKGKAVGWS
eukprot:5055840-Pleurochrysis_carterae.AAC.1